MRCLYLHVPLYLCRSPYFPECCGKSGCICPPPCYSSLWFVPLPGTVLMLLTIFAYDVIYGIVTCEFSNEIGDCVLTFGKTSINIDGASILSAAVRRSGVLGGVIRLGRLGLLLVGFWQASAMTGSHATQNQFSDFHLCSKAWTSGVEVHIQSWPICYMSHIQRQMCDLQY